MVGVTWLDWIAVVMLIGFVVQGMFKGGIASLLGALALTVAYAAAAVAFPALGERITRGSPLPLEWGRAVGFVLAFLAAYTVLAVLISILPGGKRPSMPSQVLGIFTGALKALVAAMAGVGILLASPLSGTIAQDVERSPIVRHVAAAQRGAIVQLQGISPIPFPPVGPDHKF